MNWKKITLLLLILLIADQALKIWIKTHLCIDEAIIVFPDWFQLRFIENNGAAFGMQIAKSGVVDWGKIALSLFRIGLCGFMIWFIDKLIRMKAPTGAILGLVLVLAGAIGNIIDSAIYGVIFSASTPTTVAQFGGSYAPFLMGKVVDMFYFPLFRWESCPTWLDFLVDSRNYFFGAIFNLADAYISVAAVYLLLFQFRFFNKNF